ncbi:MAG: enoyl-CoA hydratase/isomerase family protein, partial [Algicola sp.]|nr:enoyl-CoA hydratase/isomerase family protein [Algicola sp.]
LCLSTTSTGKDLAAKGWTCPILPQQQVETHAQQLAANLAAKSGDALILLKQHLSRHLVEAVNGLTVAKPIQRQNQADSVLEIAIGKNGLEGLLQDLQSVFAELDRTGYRALVISSKHPSSKQSSLTQASEQPANESTVLALKELLLGAKLPIVAALESDCKDIDWLISLCCDACIYQNKGQYGAANIWHNDTIASLAQQIFSHRLTPYFAKTLLLTGAEYSGEQLKQNVNSLTVVSKDQVLPQALQLAQQLAGLGWQQQNRPSNILPVWPVVDQAEVSATNSPVAITPKSIVLKSTVISATAHPHGVVAVTMADKLAKNMFSPAFTDGMNEVFDHIAQNPAYKVVVLNGYDNYFASGGTKETLLDIQKDQAKFTDNKVFQLAMSCPLPVISAMQGHGIGAGWVLGMNADLILLSEQSQYFSPYTRYGFTPGAGSTEIFISKIGYDLAKETLLSAQEYTGIELKKRGLALPVLPREQVIEAAMKRAEQVAQAPRSRLIALKQLFNNGLEQSLEDTYQRELDMHEKTFVGKTATLDQIEASFANESNPAPVATTKTEVINSGAVVEVKSAQISATLKTLLADELRMEEHEIDEDSQFVDLGLDSITGVTWIRKINQKYHTDIEAIAVYSYPTLNELSLFVQTEAGPQESLVVETPTAQTVPLPAGPAPIGHAVKAQPAKPLTTIRNKTSSRVSATYQPQQIAVIGMAGQFPQADNIDQFWQNISAGKNCISDIPANRWNVDSHYQAGDPVPGKTNSQWMGALNEHDLFDPLFFNISPKEAKIMDPQQRLFLQ